MDEPEDEVAGWRKKNLKDKRTKPGCEPRKGTLDWPVCHWRPNKGRKDGWTHAQTDVRISTDGQTYEQTNEKTMTERTDGRMGKRTTDVPDEGTNERRNGWMEIERSVIASIETGLGQGVDDVFGIQSDPASVISKCLHLASDALQQGCGPNALDVSSLERQRDWTLLQSEFWSCCSPTSSPPQ